MSMSAQTTARLAAIREKLLPVKQGIPEEGDAHTKEGQSCQEELATLQGHHRANLALLTLGGGIYQGPYEPVSVRLAALEKRVDKWVVIEGVGRR